MISETQTKDPGDVDRRRDAAIDSDGRNGGDRRRRSLNRTMMVIVLISCLGLAGTVTAKLPDSFSAVKPPVIQTAALQTAASPHSEAHTTQLGTAHPTSSGVAEPSNPANEGGPAILWLVALAFMAVLWLGRRNDGSI